MGAGKMKVKELKTGMVVKYDLNRDRPVESVEILGDIALVKFADIGGCGVYKVNQEIGVAE
jgi:delta-aminolevulinic acid dehydratase/porphobilinogen synthase